MGEKTAIPWCHHTFNGWRGCVHVSEGCVNCYAERDSKRNSAVLGEWGAQGRRVIAAEPYWRRPRECRRQGCAPYVKQLGSWVETSHHESIDALDEFPGEPRLSQGKIWDGNARVHLRHPRGEDPDEWPADLRVREFPGGQA